MNNQDISSLCGKAIQEIVFLKNVSTTFHMAFFIDVFRE